MSRLKDYLDTREAERHVWFVILLFSTAAAAGVLGLIFVIHTVYENYGGLGIIWLLLGVLGLVLLGGALQVYVCYRRWLVKTVVERMEV